MHHHLFLASSFFLLFKHFTEWIVRYWQVCPRPSWRSRLRQPPHWPQRRKMTKCLRCQLCPTESNIYCLQVYCFIDYVITTAPSISGATIQVMHVVLLFEIVTNLYFLCSRQTVWFSAFHPSLACLRGLNKDHWGGKENRQAILL